jgi:hypothetical protein
VAHGVSANWPRSHAGWTAFLIGGEKSRLRGGSRRNLRHSVIVLVVEGAAGKSSNLLQDAFQKPLRDLAGIQAGHLGVDHRLNELAGRNADARFQDDFGRFLEGGVGVVVQLDSNVGRFIHGLIEVWISVR